MNRAGAVMILLGSAAAAAYAYGAQLRANGGAPLLSLDLPDLELGAIAPALEDLVGLGPDAQELVNMTYETNVAAFLRMIRSAEGTAGPDGYRTLFGGRLFDHFADHPRIRVEALLGGRLIASTAAGAYQILERTWDDVWPKLQLQDFSPASQDAAAVYLIRRRGALADVRAGRFDQAVAKCAKEWASLPGSPYGQPVKTLDQVRAVYSAAGGVFA